MKKLLLSLFALVMCANVWAEDVVYKTALFGSGYNSGGISSYTDTWSATNNGFTVNLANWNNNNNQWKYIKAGRKNNASVASITTNAAIDKAVTKVVVTIDNVTASSINSIKLYSGTTSSAITTEEGSFSAATGAKSVTISTPSANKFYKIVADCKSATSNGVISVSKVEFYVADETTYERAVVADNFGTICLPKAVAAADRLGATFYNIAGVVKSGDVITDVVLEEETGDLVAGKPYVFQATDNTLYVEYNGTAVSAPVAATGLVGTLAAEGISLTTEGMYILSNNQLRKLAGGTATIAQNRAYFDLSEVAEYTPATSSSESHVVFIEVEEEGNATALSNLVSGKNNTEIYDIVGRRVEAPSKGIFIVNGKKVIIK